MTPFAVILPAAGQSTRFGGSNKLLASLAGRAVIAHTLSAFLARPDVSLIVIPTHTPRDFETFGPPDRVRLCPGGGSRAESVRSALGHVPDSIEWVAVHDAARPLVSQQLIDRTLALALKHGAAAPALAVALTIKQASAPLPARVERTIARNGLFAMQTPQIMRRLALLEAFERCPLPLDAVTDDAQLLELAGQETWLAEGEERNIKLTTPLDLRLAELLLRERP